MLRGPVESGQSRVTGLRPTGPRRRHRPNRWEQLVGDCLRQRRSPGARVTLKKELIHAPRLAQPKAELRTEVFEYIEKCLKDRRRRDSHARGCSPPGRLRRQHSEHPGGAGLSPLRGSHPPTRSSSLHQPPPLLLDGNRVHRTGTRRTCSRRCGSATNARRAAPASGAPRGAGASAHARQERGARGDLARCLLGRPPVSDLFGKGAARGWRSSSSPARSARPSTAACARSTSSTRRSRRSSARSRSTRSARRTCGG